MTVYSGRIKPTDYHIRTYLEALRGKKYQVPTFQREVVWEEDSVKKLWDSIYRFYPIGSILIWKTELQLQNHRAIGGHLITDNEHRDDFQYILDGQQRTTSLLTSLYGGKIEGKGNFDPTLYFDLTVKDEEEIDEDSYKNRFLFWNDIDDRGGSYTRNTGRMNRYQEGLIVKLRDVMTDFGSVEKRLVEGDHSDYDDPVRRRLREIRDVLDNYRLSFIELKGIEVSEVCQIFERINQEGQQLDIFDIVVAKTFRLETETQPGFYLRELVEDFRAEIPGNFAELSDLTYLQAIAIVLYQHMPDASIYNVTPTYLNRIRTEHIETVWPGVTDALRKTFDFLENYLHLKGPRLIPYRYFYMSLVSHFYENPKPNYDLLKRYFWYYSFHNEEMLRNTTHLRRHVRFLDRARTPGKAELDRFLIDREQLRTASYSTRGRLSTAILCLLANQEPRDWARPDRRVLTDVYYVLTSKPNLHHIFPTGFLAEHPGENELDSDSLMNIAYLTQLTNRDISAKDPVKYLREYDSPEFEQVLETHLVPLEILEWAREEEMPEDALDQFIERRIDLMIEELRSKLSGVTFDVIDTKEESPEAE
jgi:hypothetical protein